MKYFTYYLLIFTLLITSISCGDTVTEESTKTTSSQKKTVTVAESIDGFIKGIEDNLANLKKEKRKEGECHIEKHMSIDGQTVKVKTNCYDGSYLLCIVERYYRNGKAYVAKVYFEKYNASPMDKENFDESKSIITQRLVFFKDGDLNTIYKILDENNEVATIEGEVESGWEQAISF